MNEVPGLVSVVHSVEAAAAGVGAAAAAGGEQEDDPLTASSSGSSSQEGARQAKGGSSSNRRSKQKQKQKRGGKQPGKQQQRGARALAVASSKVLAGVPHLIEVLSGLQFHVSPHSFFQTNTRQAELLYEQVLLAVQQYYAAAAVAGSQAAASTTTSSSSSSMSAQQQQQQQPAELSGTVLDLYCGTGTISLILASRLAGSCKRVVGFDVSASSIADARANAARNGVSNVQFVCGDLTQLAEGELVGPEGNAGSPDSLVAAAAAGLDSLPNSKPVSSNMRHTSSSSSSGSVIQQVSCKPDVVVVDPARAGLSRSVVDYLLRCGTQRVVYVSCNAATQARDLQLLCGGGAAAAAAAGGADAAAAGRFKLVSWRGVDMFPQTDHLETVVVLDRC
jgi:23S rRNA (uracil1939-C5)-methyltransferase